MICKNCGIEVIVEGSKFCNNCGSRLTREENPKSEKTDRVIRLTPKEEPDGVAYYDSNVEEYVTKGKNPTCGKIGFGLYLAAAALQIAVKLKTRQDPTSALAVSLALKPIAGIFVLGALALAIVSLARKERKPFAGTTIGLMILSLVMYVSNVLNI